MGISPTDEHVWVVRVASVSADLTRVISRCDDNLPFIVGYIRIESVMKGVVRSCIPSELAVLLLNTAQVS